jgi:hypothetical protein
MRRLTLAFALTVAVVVGQGVNASGAAPLPPQGGLATATVTQQVPSIYHGFYTEIFDISLVGTLQVANNAVTDTFTLKGLTVDIQAPYLVCNPAVLQPIGCFGPSTAIIRAPAPLTGAKGLQASCSGTADYNPYDPYGIVPAVVFHLTCDTIPLTISLFNPRIPQNPYSMVGVFL